MMNYQDYVIKDGQFIGAFEAMYQDCDDPWRQTALDSPAYDVMLAWVEECRPRPSGWRRILDVGCGLGRFTAALAERTGCPVIGLDISPTAVHKAAEQRPKGAAAFVAADAAALPFHAGAFDGVMISELMWYVLPSVERVLTEVAAALRSPGALWVLQHFYPPGVQQYGKDVMQDPEDCLGLIRRAGFSVKRFADMDRETNHKLVVFAEKP